MSMHDKSAAQALAGVVGFFDEPGALIEATRKVRDSGKFRHFDAFTPYPVHGLEAAQGLKRSPLPFVTFGAGLTGFLVAILFQYWTSAVDWPLNVGGKPNFSWPAFVPIMFELTVLFAGLATVGAMLLFNGLPNIRRKSFDPRITRDRFALMIESPVVKENDETAVKFSEGEAVEFLKEVGAKDVRSVQAEGWF